jgi:hypothetical protein
MSSLETDQSLTCWLLLRVVEEEGSVHVWGGEVSVVACLISLDGSETAVIVLDRLKLFVPGLRIVFGDMRQFIFAVPEFLKRQGIERK